MQEPCSEPQRNGRFPSKRTEKGNAAPHQSYTLVPAAALALHITQPAPRCRVPSAKRRIFWQSRPSTFKSRAPMAVPICRGSSRAANQACTCALNFFFLLNFLLCARYAVDVCLRLRARFASWQSGIISASRSFPVRLSAAVVRHQPHADTRGSAIDDSASGN